MKKMGPRKRQNYDGTEITTRALGDLAHIELARIGEVYTGRYDLILKAWPEMIGPKLSAMTEAVSFFSGTLTVKVRNSTLHSLLSRHEKPRILATIKQKFPGMNIQNIVFRIG